ncbi:MAG: glycosyltransferase [Patescibacteria group bacterium]|nr:glycosyltransferase [Patescibacteria group bacterium]
MAKLVYISNSKLPTNSAHGLQIMQMCAAFAKAGDDVELVVPKRVRTLPDDPFAYYGVEKSFRIRKIPCIDFLFLHGNPFTFSVQLTSFLLLARIMVSGKGDLIFYSREPLTSLLFRGTVLEVHSLPKKTGRWYLRSLRRARVIVALTSFIRQRMIEKGIDGDKIMVAPDAVNFEKFNKEISRTEARKKLGLPLDRPLVGYVGMLRTLGMEKGIDIAVKAFADLKKEDGARLVLVGGYESDINYYKQMAADLGIADKVIATGMVKHDLVPLYLKAFDVLIAPFPETEHYRFYMSPLKIFEYMASGRPIISTHLPSLEEVLNDRNSVLVAPGSVSELKEGIVRVLSDRAFADAIAGQALKDVQKYTWDKRAESILSFARSLSQNDRRRAESENIRSFSSAESVKEYSKDYMRAGEEYVIVAFMPPGASVLDIGCGAGRTTARIAARGCGVVGIDVAEPLVRQARVLHPGIDFRVMDARDLRFKDAQFDAVFFSFNGIDNLLSREERRKAVHEMRRVLKPGGTLIYSSHNALAIPRTKKSRSILWSNLRSLRIGPHLRREVHDIGSVTQFYTNVWSESAWLRAQGFASVAVIGNSSRLLHAPRWILAFADKFPIYIAKK